MSDISVRLDRGEVLRRGKCGQTLSDLAVQTAAQSSGRSHNGCLHFPCSKQMLLLFREMTAAEKTWFLLLMHLQSHHSRKDVHGL